MNVLIVCMPSKVSDKLQVLDVTVFGPNKTHFRTFRDIMNWSKEGMLDRGAVTSPKSSQRPGSSRPAPGLSEKASGRAAWSPSIRIGCRSMEMNSSSMTFSPTLAWRRFSAVCWHRRALDFSIGVYGGKRELIHAPTLVYKLPRSLQWTCVLRHTLSWRPCERKLCQRGNVVGSRLSHASKEQSQRSVAASFNALGEPKAKARILNMAERVWRSLRSWLRRAGKSRN